MIQYYSDILEQVNRVRDAHLTGGQIQKIYSTAFFVSLSIRTPGKTWHLYLGRGSGTEGIWLHDAAPPSRLRRKDNYLEYLRRYLSSCTFLGIEIDKSDRIVCINYQKYGQQESFLLFWMARKLYFIHYFRENPDSPMKLLLSWKGKAVPVDADLRPLHEYFEEVGRRSDMLHDMKSRQPLNIEELLQQEEKAADLKLQTSQPGFLKRKRENIEQDLRKNQQWHKLQSLIDKNANLEGIYELKVGDHKIKFEGELNPFERRDLVFKKIKKLKRGESILQERLKNLEEEHPDRPHSAQYVSQLPINKPVWGKEGARTETQAAVAEATDYKIFKFDNFQVGVGVSARGNDQLRSRWANKDDIWLHLDGLKSAHAIIKLLKPDALTPEVLNLASSILAQFSHFKGDWIPIIYTPVKNLKGVTGAPGMVIYKKEKHLTCPLVPVNELRE